MAIVIEYDGELSEVLIEMKRWGTEAWKLKKKGLISMMVVLVATAHTPKMEVDEWVFGFKSLRSEMKQCGRGYQSENRG